MIKMGDILHQSYTKSEYFRPFLLIYSAKSYIKAEISVPKCSVFGTKKH